MRHPSKANDLNDLNSGRAGTRTPDLLRVKKNLRLQMLQSLYTEVPFINNLGNLLSLK
jgi:hypothetical protein